MTEPGKRANVRFTAAVETATPITYIAPSKAAYLKFADETEAALRRDVLDVWFPLTVDKENGGFHSNFTRDCGDPQMRSVPALRDAATPSSCVDLNL